MTAVAPRRAFLQGLASLPLVGGGVSLVGSPTAVAEPVGRLLIAQYWNWLFYERRLLCVEMAGGDRQLQHMLEHTRGGDPFAPVDPGREVGWLCSRSWPGVPLHDDQRLPDFHFPRSGEWTDVPKPSTRAALVMGAADFDWRPVPR